MKKLLFMMLLIVFISACSNQGASDAGYEMTEESYDYDDSYMVERDLAYSESADGEEEEQVRSSELLKSEDSNRKVIYTADIGVETKNYQEYSDLVQQETIRLGGYVVESTLYNEHSDGAKSGRIMVRIPQEEFQAFIEIVEEGSTRVIDHYVSGQDVTEEFVDLESRLKSKRRVEERLVEFMENAEKTEDLLKISSDLAQVQEEIEMIVGRMNYLQDKTDFSTVTISIHENLVTLSANDDLNTWAETKDQFMRSINFLMTASSSIIVFLVGNLPLFIILLGIALIIKYLWKKRKK